MNPHLATPELEAAGAPLAAELRRFSAPLLFVTVWTAFALLLTLSFRFGLKLYGTRELGWTDSFAIGFLNAYSTALVALAAFLIARRLPLRPGGVLRAALLHLSLGLGVIVAVRLLYHFAIPWVTDQPRQPLEQRLATALPGELFIYLLLLGAAYGIVYFQRYRERELIATRLERQLAEAQLQVLKMQLHPHFLFNALNSVSALMQRDVTAADRTLARLEDLLRLSLEKASAQEVPLRDELELLEPYLEIEQIRFGERLRVEWNIEQDTLDACVPHLLLQPLVENAIRHGIAPRSARGRIEISARREGERLALEVRDNGKGVSARPSGVLASGGVGLANTRARLQQLYAAEHAFSIENAVDGGAVVRIAIPYRPSLRAAAGAGVPESAPSHAPWPALTTAG